MRFEVWSLGCSEADRWQAAVSTSGWNTDDIYFSPDWYRVWQETGGGQAVCLHGQAEGAEWLYPFLLNPIIDTPGACGWYDAETAYGYGGIITRGEINPDGLKQFNRRIDEWMQDQRVVVEFVRQHPFVAREQSRAHPMVPVRNNVYLDLTGRDPKSVWTRVLSCKTRNTLRKAERDGLCAQAGAGTPQVLSVFRDLYHQTASRKGMKPFYFFSETFFEALHSNLKEKVEAIWIRRGEDVLAASLWLNHPGWSHYFLAASACGSSRYPCADLYMWRKICRELASSDSRRLHYGGGMSLAEGDSLFRFKKKYANGVVPVYVGSKIHHPDIYHEILATWRNAYPGLVQTEGNRVMCYRERPSGVQASC